MARRQFPSETFTAGVSPSSSNLRVVANMHVEVFTDLACTTLADIVSLDLDTIATVVIVESEMELFYGPDGAVTLYYRPVDGTGNGVEIEAVQDASTKVEQADFTALSIEVDTKASTDELAALSNTVGGLSARLDDLQGSSEVLGSHSDGTALANLITTLAGLGIISDSTTA